MSNSVSKKGHRLVRVDFVPFRKKVCIAAVRIQGLTLFGLVVSQEADEFEAKLESLNSDEVGETLLQLVKKNPNWVNGAMFNDDIEAFRSELDQRFRRRIAN